jgi:hypothetical protein
MSTRRRKHNYARQNAGRAFTARQERQIRRMETRAIYGKGKRP